MTAKEPEMRTWNVERYKNIEKSTGSKNYKRPLGSSRAARVEKRRVVHEVSKAKVIETMSCLRVERPKLLRPCRARREEYQYVRCLEGGLLATAAGSHCVLSGFRFNFAEAGNDIPCKRV